MKFVKNLIDIFNGSNTREAPIHETWNSSELDLNGTLNDMSNTLQGLGNKIYNNNPLKKKRNISAPVTPGLLICMHCHSQTSTDTPRQEWGKCCGRQLPLGNLYKDISSDTKSVLTGSDRDTASVTSINSGDSSDLGTRIRYSKESLRNTPPQSRGSSNSMSNAININKLRAIRASLEPKLRSNNRMNILVHALDDDPDVCIT